jgi:hypothetical protein
VTWAIANFVIVADDNDPRPPDILRRQRRYSMAAPDQQELHADLHRLDDRPGSRYRDAQALGIRQGETANVAHRPAPEPDAGTWKTMMVLKR